MCYFFFNDTATTEIYTLSLHDALPISSSGPALRVALFITCVNDTLFPDTGRATVRVLERLGHEVVFPLEQTCCGQMHANSGYQLEAVPLVRRFVRAFGDPSLDAIVCPSGSCAAMVHDQYGRLAELSGDEELAQAVAAV